MSVIRVLVVDDSVVVRRLVTNAIDSDPCCKVIGTAANGKLALAKIAQIRPDVVTLDVEMPEMDGLETMAAIRKAYPKLPVIMFSTVTERAAAATIKALALGATDYVTKPSGTNLEEAVQRVRESLLPKIRYFGAAALGTVQPSPPTTSFPPVSTVRATTLPMAPRRSFPTTPIEIVAIGSSTGGPNALAVVLDRLAKALPVPIVITQHMPPLFTRLLAERLRTQSSLRVREASGGEELLPGDIWIAPGDHHMFVRRDASTRRIALNQAPHENSCRPAVDVLFRSVADLYGPAVLAVVLTGMGQDGLRGCELVRDAGGQIIVQNAATSVVWGMPGFVAKAGLSDAILPIEQIGGEIVRRISGRLTLLPSAPTLRAPHGD